MGTSKSRSQLDKGSENGQRGTVHPFIALEACLACGDRAVAYVVKSGSKLLHSPMVLGFGLADLMDWLLGAKANAAACRVARSISGA
jgi:hypothetical protein